MGFSEYVSSPLFLGVPHAAASLGRGAAAVAAAPQATATAAPMAAAKAAPWAANVVASAPYPLGLPEVPMSGPADATIAAAVAALAAAAAVPNVGLPAGTPVLGGLLDNPTATLAVGLVGGLMVAWHKVLAPQASLNAAAAPNAASQAAAVFATTAFPLAALKGWQSIPRAPKAVTNTEGAAAFLISGTGATSEPIMKEYERSSPIRCMADAAATDPALWSMAEITPDGKLAQRVEGKTRKTWKFNDLSKDRVQVAVASEGRPVHAGIQLWLGPDWTPMSMKVYSEDGKLRPINTLIGTRNKAAMIEVMNQGEYEFPIKAASNYAKGAMVEVPFEIPASTEGTRCDGGAIRSFPIDASAEKVEVVLNTDGRQLNARVELLNAPNNPKQTFETFTNNGELNSLVVCFDTPDPGNTVRVVNLAPVEFPCYIHLREL